MTLPLEADQGVAVVSFSTAFLSFSTVRRLPIVMRGPVGQHWMSIDRPPWELHQGDLLETARKQVQIMFLRLPKEESRSASGNGANLFAAVTSRSLDTEGRGVRRSYPPRRSSIRTGVRLIVDLSLVKPGLRIIL